MNQLSQLDIDRFHAGDERLFAELVPSYSPRLVPHLRRYAASPADVADLLQDVWLRAYQKRRTFEGRGSLFGWLLTICRTVGLAAVSNRDVTVDSDPTLQLAAPDDIEPELQRRTDWEQLRAAVDCLPPRQREIVLLRLVEDRSTAETARTLGCAEGTVKAALHSAIQNLQNIVKEKVG